MLKLAINTSKENNKCRKYRLHIWKAKDVIPYRIGFPKISKGWFWISKKSFSKINKKKKWILEKWVELIESSSKKEIKMANYYMENINLTSNKRKSG